MNISRHIFYGIRTASNRNRKTVSIIGVIGLGCAYSIWNMDKPEAETLPLNTSINDSFTHTRRTVILPSITPNMSINKLFTQEELSHCPLTRLNACVNGTRDHAFWAAVELGKTDLVIKMLESGFEPHIYNDVALELACVKGNVKLVKILLADPRVDPNSPYRKTLYLTDGSDTNRQIKKLLCEDSRFDFSADNNELLKYAIREDKMELITELISMPSVMGESDINWIMYKAINEALNKKSPEGNQIVNILLSGYDRYDINDVICRGIYFNNVDMIDAILTRKSFDQFDINMALEYAVQYGRINMVRPMIAYDGSDPNAVFDKIKTERPLNTWDSEQTEDAIELLFSDPRFDTRKDNDAAIMCASRRGYTRLVKKMINEPSIKNDLDMRAIATEALDNNNDEVFEMLLSEINDPYCVKEILNMPGVDDYNISKALVLSLKSGNVDISKILINDERFNPEIFVRNAAKTYSDRQRRE